MEIKTNKALCAVLEASEPFQTVCGAHKRANLQNRVLYVLHTIQKTGRADYMAMNDFLCKEWRVIKAILTENNVLTCQDGEYFFCKDKYSVNPAYCKKDCTVSIADTTAKKWNKRSAQSKRVSVKKHSKRMCNAESVPEGVKQWHKAFKKVGVDRTALHTILESVSMDEKTSAQQMEYLRQIEDKDCYFPRLNKGRIYTPFHGVKKELRECLTLDGEPLKEMCDVRGAFQTASASMFSSLYTDFADEGQAFIRQIDRGLRERIAENRKIAKTHLKNVLMFLWFASNSERQRALECDYKLFFDIKNTVVLTPYSRSSSSNKVGDSELKRLTEDEIRKVGDSAPFQEWCAKVGVSLSVNQKKYLSVLYGDEWLKRPANDVLRYVGIGAEIDCMFKSHAPAFWYFVRGYAHERRKGTVKSCLPTDLMQYEGDAVFCMILPAVSLFFHKGVLSLHDALFTAESDSDRITGEMFNHLYRDAIAFQAEKQYYVEKFAEDRGTEFYNGVLGMLERKEKEKIQEYRRYVADYIYHQKSA